MLRTFYQLKATHKIQPIQISILLIQDVIYMKRSGQERV